MKLQLFILLITGFIIANIYYDGKYLKMIKQWKKYYQMIFYLFIGLSLMIFIRKNPNDGKVLLSHAHNFIKYMPMDKDSGDFLTPLFKISQYNNYNSPQVSRMMNSGGTENKFVPTKRSVSETKKKFVASQQNWKCGKCGCQLPAWFEIDHKERLEYGGDNHISNLVALCRNCHGEKTAMENM